MAMDQSMSENLRAGSYAEQTYCPTVGLSQSPMMFGFHVRNWTVVKLPGMLLARVSLNW